MSVTASEPGARQAGLVVENLRVRLPGPHGGVELVRGVDLHVAPGECLGLVGESGAGKSLTCYAAMGLVERSGLQVSGQVWVSGQEFTALARSDRSRMRGDHVAMIFQEPSVSLNPAYPVGAQIAEVVRCHRGLSRRAAKERAVECLAMAGVPNPKRRAGEYPHTLSGGLRQRAMIAMAISCEPEVLIADEATTALDVTIQAQILNLLKELQETLGMALLVVTHDLGVVADVCDRVAVMYAGRTVEEGPVLDVFRAPAHPYTRGLLDAVPSVTSTAGGLVGIPGTVPAPDRPPPGCRFAPRCAHAMRACQDIEPELVAIDTKRSTSCGRWQDVTSAASGRTAAC